MMKVKNEAMRLLTKTRLRVASVTKAVGFSESLLESIYDAYAGHHKVIHWRDGCPVYSTFSAPAYSKVQAHQMAMKLMGIFQNRTLPNMMDLAITGNCNSDCVHCSFKSMKSSKSEMSTAQAIDIIKQAQDLGVTVINFLGGEPLLRKEILTIISSIDKNKSVSLMFTNGWFLESFAFRLKKAGLDSINVSIDSPIPNQHDTLRNTPGLFEKAVKGINSAKKAGLTVAISCCITKESLQDGTLMGIIELGKRLGVHEIIVFDALPTGGIADRADLLNDTEWTSEIMSIADRLNKRYDYPSIYPYCHVRSHKSLGCCGGSSFFYVTPYGDVCPCDFNPISFGNLLDRPLYQIWDKISRNQNFSSSSWDGCRIQDKKYREEFKMDLKKGAKCRKAL